MKNLIVATVLVLATSTVQANEQKLRSLLQPLEARVDGNTNDYYIGYRGGDYNTAWAKYYNDSTVPLSDEFLQGLARSPVDPKLGTPFTNAGSALNQPGYLQLENGYTILDDGTMQLATRVDVPSSFTGEMYDFWFSWHTNDTTKYKLWNPGQHQYAALSAQDLAAEQNKTSYRQRYWNVTSFVDEYIGQTAYKLSIGFFEPGLLNFSIDHAATGVQTIVTAYVKIFSYTDEQPGQMTKNGLTGLDVVLAHQVRAKPDGSGNEIRSRFWFGNLLVSGMRLIGMDPYQLAHDLSVHCATEMAHLGTFLPALFEEFKDNIPQGSD